MSVVVNESLVRAIGKSEKGGKIVSRMCAELEKMAPKIAKLSEIFRAATDELLEITNVLKQLLGEADPDTQALNVVFGTKSGSKQLVRHALAKDSFWAEQEKSTRAIAVSWLTLKPEVDKNKEIVERRSAKRFWFLGEAETGVKVPLHFWG